MLVNKTSTLFTPFRLATILCFTLIVGCSAKPSNSKPGISKPVSWSNLTGWSQENHTALLSPLLIQCEKLAKKDNQWKSICSAAGNLDSNNASSIKQFFHEWFQPHSVVGINNSRSGLITGYFEPLLKGSLHKTDKYYYPLYSKPNDLIKVDPTDNLLQVKDKRARGRSVNNTVIPYYSRAQIDGPNNPLAGQELLWVDNSDDAFFLHIQGSGLVELEDGRIIGVGYADQNGHPYHAIGRDLVNTDQIAKEDISLQSIKQWLVDNPKKAQDLKNKNPSYIFFTLRKEIEHGPRGSLNVPLTAERSVAVDRSIIPLGTPIWLSTTLPNSSQPYQRLVYAQDTGGAINGPIRADVFFGRGERAKRLAGEMKQEGQILVLLPKK